MAAREFNFDGLVGPTHNYAGLSYGNVASATHQNRPSNPRQAALQGLEKMKCLHEMGVGQAILPPLPRPDFSFLRAVGFRGDSNQLLREAAKEDPVLLACGLSASNMWTANAATVSPSADCRDGRLHLSVANLSHGLHRSIEAEGTYQVLRQIFHSAEHFQVHPALPASAALSDEGAANHTRLCREYGEAGLEMFVYGKTAFDRAQEMPTQFPARQTREASQAICRIHGLDSQRTVFIQQHPEAIDAGVFHNDVISVGNQDVLLCHERSFYHQAEMLAETRSKFSEITGRELNILELPEADISLKDCVTSYLFNSQLVTRDDGQMVLICPIESREQPAAFAATQRIVNELEVIEEVQYLDLRQSMNNGGGPACLRLRVVLEASQVEALPVGIRFDEERYQQLVEIVSKHYRDRLDPDELCDPDWHQELKSTYEQIYLALGLRLPV